MQVLDAYKDQAQNRRRQIGGSRRVSRRAKSKEKILPQYPPPSSPPKEVELSLSMPHREGEIHEEVDPKEEERVFKKAFLDMTEMVRILYQERNESLEGEGSKLHKEG